jgi:hypothetical protein
LQRRLRHPQKHHPLRGHFDLQFPTGRLQHVKQPFLLCATTTRSTGAAFLQQRRAKLFSVAANKLINVKPITNFFIFTPLEKEAHPYQTHVPSLLFQTFTCELAITERLFR